MIVRHSRTSGGAAAAPRLISRDLVRPCHGSCPCNGGCHADASVVTDVLELPSDRIEPELGIEGGGSHVPRLVVGGYVARAFTSNRHIDIGLKLAPFIGAKIGDGNPPDVDGDLGVRLKAEALDRYVASSVATGWVEKE